MFVCLCNGYSDDEIRKVAVNGATTAADAYEALGHGPACGTCLPFAQQLIDQVRLNPASLPKETSAETCP